MNNKKTKDKVSDEEMILNVKKYFVFAFKKYIDNENKILAKSFEPSIRELIWDYISIYEDTMYDKENRKLLNSKLELIGAIQFYFKNSILFKRNVYREELQSIINDFESIISNKSDDKINEIKIYNKSKAMIKMINNDNIYKKLSDLIKSTKSYSEADKIIKTIISELMYDGFSLKHIQNWYNYMLKNNPIESKLENIDFILDGFCRWNKEDILLTYYITIKSKNELDDEIYLNHNLIMNKQKYEDLNLVDEKKNKDFKPFLQYGKDVNIYTINLRCKDMYKGLEIITESIKSYFQMINYVSSGETVLNDKIVVSTEKNILGIRNKNYDESILFYESERRDKADIEDFIEYRDKVYLMNRDFNEVSTMQRAINIIKGQINQSKDNRLINLWSVLEYLLTFSGNSSIISKVKEIIPKLVCMYFIKDKLNTFWNTLNQFSNKGYNQVDEIIKSCRISDDEYRYDLDKLISYISNKDKIIINELEFNEVLKRQITEIGMLLFKVNDRKNNIEYVYKSVEYDLVRIYRDRNILIHSSKRNIKNINYKTLRLHYYNNSIIGLIIHYKKNNPSLTIEEILNSIEYTYNKYLICIDKKSNESELYNICRPKYIFIE